MLNNLVNYNNKKKIKKKNIIKGILDISQYCIDHKSYIDNPTLFNTDNIEGIDVYLNKNKINILKDKFINNLWRIDKSHFEKAGKYEFHIIFNDTIIDMSGFFSCNECIFLDFSDFDTSNITNMYCMFKQCCHLKEIKGINKFNTDKVTNMGGMFEMCSQLENLDLSSFNTSNVTNMEYMFGGCSELKQVKGIENFVTNKVVNMQYMFSYCKSLELLNLSRFNTSNVINMEGMFWYCDKLKYLNLLNFTINCNTNNMLKFSKQNCEFITKNKELLKSYKSSYQ